MQGRQVWMLSRLCNEVDRKPEWLSAARIGADFLRRNAFDARGRCWFSTSREGKPAFFQRKPYSGVFVALGFLEYARATGDLWFREKAIDLFWKVREWIGDARLLDRPPLEGAPSFSQLADIYALTSLALEFVREEAGNARYHGILKECLLKVRLHYEPSRRLLMENASTDPAFRSLPEGRLVCAGSIFEICWFLFRALDLHPDPELERLLLQAVEGAIEFGWDREYGGFSYFQDLEGRSPAQLEANMKLWWVHAEALYCLLACFHRTRDEKWLRWLEEVVDWTWRHFPDPQYGEWFGYLDRRGDPALSLKGGSYKGCFHIPRALLFSLQLLEQMRPNPR
jgi:N-acylglucosamine 2-epimerase